MKTIIEVVLGAVIVLGGLFWAYKKFLAAKVAAAETAVKAVVTKVEGDL